MPALWRRGLDLPGAAVCEYGKPRVPILLQADKIELARGMSVTADGVIAELIQQRVGQHAGGGIERGIGRQRQQGLGSPPDVPACEGFDRCHADRFGYGVVRRHRRGAASRQIQGASHRHVARGESLRGTVEGPLRRRVEERAVGRAQGGQLPCFVTWIDKQAGGDLGYGRGGHGLFRILARVDKGARGREGQQQSGQERHGNRAGTRGGGDNDKHSAVPGV